jgi:opacity protein-like surface antigen
MKRPIILASLAVFLMASSASAQTAVPNPLRAAPERNAETPKTGVAAAGTVQPDTTKPKRERSAKQKQGDEDMRSCGASWRNDKDALKAKGETWRTYLKSCRAQLKSSRGA